MGKRAILLIVLGFPVLMFALGAWRAVQMARSGAVPEALRDVDCDGRVSFLEWLRIGVDFRVRDSQAHPGCREVYSERSGRVLVLRCAEPPECRRQRPAGSPAP